MFGSLMKHLVAILANKVSLCFHMFIDNKNNKDFSQLKNYPFETSCPCHVTLNALIGSIERVYKAYWS